MKIFKKIIIIMSLVGLIITCIYMPPIKSYSIDEPFQFNDNGEFTILHLADLHEILHERKDLDPANKDFIKNAIDYNKPDLVILGGDNIFPVSLFGEITTQETLRTIRAFYKVFDSLNQPWTIIFGNHDDEALYNKTAQYKVCMESDNFVGGYEENSNYTHFVDKDNDMVGNTKISIYDNQQIKYNIFTIDSGSYRNTGFPNTISKDYWYNYIRKPQIDWYVQEAGDSIPNIVLTHIPLHEFREYSNKQNDTDYVIEFKGYFGGYMLSETRCEFFPIAIEKTNIKAIFTGHMHDNNLTMLCKTQKQNIILSTTKKASDYNYIHEKQGNARVIKLNKNGGLTTYEYTEDMAYNHLIYR